MNFGTLFSGGEGVGVGLTSAGLHHAWGIEYDAQIAAVAQANGFDVRVADVRAVDYAALPRVDWLHASPSCTRASVANANAGEAREDIETAAAVVRALDAQQPAIFTLENVWRYRTFKAFRDICDALGRHGYIWTYSHENAASYGVPQTRKRLILRASRGLLPPMPQPVPWVGWYAAIEDLLPTLPKSKLAPWQLARLPEELRGRVLISKTADKFEHGSKAILVAGLLNTNGTKLTRRDGGEPSFTVTTSLNQKDVRAAVGVRVVSMTPRCLARFQSVPDSYWLPDGRALAAKVIGNMVPPLLMQRIAEGMTA